jgi:zinc protease
VLRGGNLEALRGQAEVASILAAMFDKGTPQLSRQQVQDRLDALRTQIAFSFDALAPGTLAVDIQSRRVHLPAAIELVGQLLRSPAFDPTLLDELKRQSVAAIEAQRQEPQAIVQDALVRHGNPYARGDIRHARSFDERLQDLAAVTPDALRALHARLLGASRVELAVVGDFDAAAVRGATERALGGWPTAVAYERVPRPFIAAAPARLVFRTPDKQNAVLQIVQPIALQESDPDFAALAMANYLLGGGGNSRLWRLIRETEGLSYDVYATLVWNLYEPNTWWVGGANFAPANRAKVEAAYRAVVDLALKDGFGTRELEEGKTGLLSFRRLARAQDGTVAETWARNLDLGRTFARAAQVDAQLKALSVEQVNAALRKYIDPAKWVVGVAGDFKE